MPLLKRPKRPHKHQDPSEHDFWYPPYIGAWNQNVRSSCSCGLLGPYLSVSYSWRVGLLGSVKRFQDCILHLRPSLNGARFRVRPQDQHPARTANYESKIHPQTLMQIWWVVVVRPAQAIAETAGVNKPQDLCLTASLVRDWVDTLQVDIKCARS